MTEWGGAADYVYISSHSDDSAKAGRLGELLRAAGLPSFHRAALDPGADVARAIRQGIGGAFAFLACFSDSPVTRRSVQNEEIVLAIDEVRKRPLGTPWLIPVRFTDCQVPDFDLGAGHTMADIVPADMFDPNWDEAGARLVASLLDLRRRPENLGPVLGEIYQADQRLVAASITALREGARLMLGPTAGELDLFGPQGIEVLGERGWHVLRNYAELALPAGQLLTLEIINASSDPEYRRALTQWSKQNPELLGDEPAAPMPVFERAAAIDLEGYAAEFRDPVPELAVALANGRLPVPPSLIARSPEIARLAMRLWRVTSTDSPLGVKLLRAQPAGQPRHSEPAEIQPASDPAASERTVADVLTDATKPEKGDARISVLDVLGLVFKIPAGQPPLEDIDSFIAESPFGLGAKCLVEWRNVAGPLRVADVAGQLLAAEAAAPNQPIDHFILIAPHADPDEQLDELAERWNKEQHYPFNVQIWSPRSNIKKLLEISPPVYRSFYGADPESSPDPLQALASFIGQVRPPVRLPERLRKYLREPRSFVESKEAPWLDQLSSRIERFGYDEQGTRLGQPLQAEIVSALLSSPGEPGVALLLAEFGEGKSFFTVALCESLRRYYLGDPQAGHPIPVRLLLRDYRHTDSPVEFLRTQLERIGLGLEGWSELIRQPVLVILDGLDEMSVRQDAATTRRNLDKLSDLLEQLEGLPVLVTSRPHFFASAPDRERFYDRLRRPRVFRMSQPDRRETVANLRAYANTPVLAAKLDKIRELYDPIGLAGKVLFLEMIKATLPELPEDRFDELVLYETYVRKSLHRKIHLLRDPKSELEDRELLAKLEKLLEQIAVAIHVSGEGNVDLRNFAAGAGGAAHLLWQATDSDQTRLETDATARIAGRSLLRRVSGDEGWVVDFFHRSMKEYFVAKAIKRALKAPDPFAATRALLLTTPVQPEILGFFRLFACEITGAPAILTSLVRSARTDSGQGILGGGAISLLYAATDQVTETDWRSLDLEGALLAGANLAGADFRHSILRGADLSQADLTGADLRDADLTEANLSAGGSVVAFGRDVEPHEYVCLTPDPAIGRIAIRSNGSLAFSFIPLPRSVRSPQGVFMPAEDTAVVIGQSEFLIVGLGDRTAEELAYFRMSGDLRAVTMLGDSMLGVLSEPEGSLCEALMIDLDEGTVCWQIPVSPHGRVFGWSTDGVLINYDKDLIFYRHDRPHGRIDVSAQLAGHSLSVSQAHATAVTNDGRVIWLDLNGSADPEALAAHDGAGTAVLADEPYVLSAGSDGSIALIRRDTAGQPGVLKRLERRLRSTDAKINGLKRDRERLTFLANGAKDDR